MVLKSARGRGFAFEIISFFSFTLCLRMAFGQDLTPISESSFTVRLESYLFLNTDASSARSQEIRNRLEAQHLKSTDLIKDDDLNDLILWIHSRATPHTVTYNNTLARLEYKDRLLQEAVRLLRNIIFRGIDEQEVHKRFLKLSSESRNLMTQDVDSIDPLSRLDIIDLISDFVETHLQIESISNVNFQSLHMFAKDFVLHSFDKTNLRPEPSVVAFRTAQDPQNSFLLLCSSSEAELTDIEGHPRGIAFPKSKFYIQPRVFRLDRSDSDPLAALLKCGGSNFDISEEKKNWPALEFPPKIDYSFLEKNKFEVLVSFGLLGNLSSSVVEDFKGVTEKLLGYRAEFGPVISGGLKSEALKYLRQSDAFIPIAHQLSFESFPLGKSSDVRVLTLTKQVNHPRHPNEKLDVTVRVLLPEPNEKTETVVISQPELLSTLKDRTNFPNIMIMSCHSDTMIPGWIYAARAQLSESTNIHFLSPWVLASSGGFSTSTLQESLSHVMWVAKFIDELAGAHTENKIAENLKAFNPVSSDHEKFKPLYTDSIAILQIENLNTKKVFQY